MVEVMAMVTIKIIMMLAVMVQMMMEAVIAGPIMKTNNDDT